MSGLPAPVTIAERHIRTIIDPGPSNGVVYTLDAQTRTARAAPRSLLGMTTGGSFRVFGTRRRRAIPGLLNGRGICCRRNRARLPTCETSPSAASSLRE